MIVKRTGQFDQNNAELVIVIDVKLTRASAEAVAEQKGGEVKRMLATKEIE